ncbi:MAG TPA: hypothetical protein V6D25_21595 [Leptolyngbyaceae cyanobacterium]
MTRNISLHPCLLTHKGIYLELSARIKLWKILWMNYLLYLLRSPPVGRSPSPDNLLNL